MWGFGYSEPVGGSCAALDDKKDGWIVCRGAWGLRIQAQGSGMKIRGFRIQAQGFMGFNRLC